MIAAPRRGIAVVRRGIVVARRVIAVARRVIAVARRVIAIARRVIAITRGGIASSRGGSAVTRAEGGRGGAPGTPRGVLRSRSRRAYETRLPHPRARPRDFADLRLAAVMRSRRTMGRAVPTNPPPRDLPAVQRRKDKHPMASKTKPVSFTVRLLRRPIPRLPKGGLATPTTTWGVCSLRTSCGGLATLQTTWGEVLYATPRRSSLSLALLGSRSRTPRYAVP